MLEPFGGATGLRHEVVARTLDDRTPARQVLLSVTTRTGRAPLASSLVLDQLEALGEGQIFVFDIRRERVRYMAAELARMVGHSMEDPLDMEAVRAGWCIPMTSRRWSTYFTGSARWAPPPSRTSPCAPPRPEGGWRWLEVRGRALTLGRRRQAALGAGRRHRRHRTPRHVAGARPRRPRGAARRRGRSAGASRATSTTPPPSTWSPSTSGSRSLERRSFAAVRRPAHPAGHARPLSPPRIARSAPTPICCIRRSCSGWAWRRRCGVSWKGSGAGRSWRSAWTSTAGRRSRRRPELAHVPRGAGGGDERAPPLGRSPGEVRLCARPRPIVLEVEDDGVGLPANRTCARQPRRRRRHPRHAGALGAARRRRSTSSRSRRGCG